MSRTVLRVGGRDTRERERERERITFVCTGGSQNDMIYLLSALKGCLESKKFQFLVTFKDSF